MKKTYMLEDLDCAHCAAKMEAGIRKIAGVTDACVNFFAQKLTIEAADEDFDRVLAEAIAVCRKIEPDCRVILK